MTAFGHATILSAPSLRLGLLLGSLLGCASGRDHQPAEQPLPPFEPSRETASLAEDRASSSADPQGPTALDGLSLEELVAYRRARVGETAELGLFPRDYDPLSGPSRRIYAGITPGRRWLGPTAYYVANPAQLIVMTCADHVTPLALACPGTRLTYSYRRIEEVHEGEAARCWLGVAFDGTSTKPPGTLRVIMVNAFDAGFHYAHVDPQLSANLQSEQAPDGIVGGLFSQPSLFHVGKYGVNNISPRDPRGWIRLAQPDAVTRIHIKLWRARPSSPAARAEMTWEVRVDPHS